MASIEIQNIKELVHTASVAIAHYWPMTTFVHHNPIRNLETLPFEEAIQVARRFVGGHGYLSNVMYRDLLNSGRISSRHLDLAVKSFAENKVVKLAGADITHFEVLRVHLLEGITSPVDEAINALVKRSPNRSFVHSLARKLNIKDETEHDSCAIARDISLSTWCDQSINTQLVYQIDRELIKWCEAFMDEGHASWPMPERDKGFYAAWRSLAAQEWSPCRIKESSNKIKALPESPEQALLEHLEALGIPLELRQDYLSLQLTALYGWSSFINWRSEQGSYQWQSAYPIDLVQYLAVRLFYERELVDQACQVELGIEGKFDSILLHQRNTPDTYSREHAKLAAAWRLTRLADALGISQEVFAASSVNHLQELLSWLDVFPESNHGAVWLKAYEAGYQEDFVNKLQSSVSKPELNETKTGRPSAQILFCIDVRSEPFRRNFEAAGNYETIGFAGFFGIPIRCQSFGQSHETDQFPAIVEAKYQVHEVVREGQASCHSKHVSRKGFLAMLQQIFSDLKYQVLSPYIMVEALGWLFGLQILEKTIFPGTYRKWRKQLQTAFVPKLSTEMTADKDDVGRGLTDAEQNATIETVLKMMGLVKNFGRLVVVAGHTSMSDNNPYEAALNCGACGGHSGEPNARLFAAIANKPQVREYLANNGIVIPEDTHFLGAVHNTTTDAVDLFDLEDLPESHLQDLEQLKADLKKAAVHTNHERCMRLPGVSKDLSFASAAQEITRRSADWSETRPEWGLSGNASFIIGRRSLTCDLNFEGRTFLNSYDYRLDPTGVLLEGILMGPMVVGQWINAEHYFSATDPEIYGSGSKIYHNVVGRVGIMSGPESDLRTGLALQSVTNGDSMYHEPLRLLVAIEAPRERILAIIEKQAILKQLCDNEWIHLLAIDHETDKKLYRYKAKQGWIDVEK